MLRAAQNEAAALKDSLIKSLEKELKTLRATQSNAVQQSHEQSVRHEETSMCTEEELKRLRDSHKEGVALQLHTNERSAQEDKTIKGLEEELLRVESLLKDASAFLEGSSLGIDEVRLHSTSHLFCKRELLRLEGLLRDASAIL